MNNYGLGGQYEIHFDYAKVKSDLYQYTIVLYFCFNF